MADLEGSLHHNHNGNYNNGIISVELNQMERQKGKYLIYPVFVFL